MGCKWKLRRHSQVCCLLSRQLCWYPSSMRFLGNIERKTYGISEDRWAWRGEIRTGARSHLVEDSGRWYSWLRRLQFSQMRRTCRLNWKWKLYSLNSIPKRQSKSWESRHPGQLTAILTSFFIGKPLPDPNRRQTEEDQAIFRRLCHKRTREIERFKYGSQFLAGWFKLRNSLSKKGGNLYHYRKSE